MLGCELKVGIASMLFQCKCGDSFKDRRKLVEHIGLLNPRWPRTSPSDEHGNASKSNQQLQNEARERNVRGYRLLRDGN